MSSVLTLDPAVARQLRRDRRRARLRRNAVAWSFAAPAVLAWIAFMAYPVGKVVRQSFQAGGVLGKPRDVGFENWSRVFSDTQFVASIKHTLTFAGLIVPGVLIAALFVALVLQRIRRGQGVARGIVYFPTLAPVVLAALVWQFVVHPDFGLLNIGNRAVGLEPINWLGDTHNAFVAISMLEVWRGAGFWAVFLLAAMLAVPASLYQAASVDGASALRRFWHVTLPGIRGPLVLAALLITIASLQIFDSIYILTAGGPSGSTYTAGYYIWRSLFEFANPGYGAALSLTLMAVIVLVTGALALVTRRRER